MKGQWAQSQLATHVRTCTAVWALFIVLYLRHCVCVGGWGQACGWCWSRQGTLARARAVVGTNVITSVVCISIVLVHYHTSNTGVT